MACGAGLPAELAGGCPELPVVQRQAYQHDGDGQSDGTGGYHPARRVKWGVGNYCEEAKWLGKEK